MRYTALLFIITLAAGCGVSAPIEGRHDPFVPPQVQFTSEDLRTDTAIGTPITSRDPYGYLKVTVPIRNTNNKQLYIDYRVTFLDKNGQPLYTPTGWIGKTLAPNVSDNIMATSTNPAAADFQIDLRHTRIQYE